MNQLDILRQNIDEIDKELIELFEKRLDISQEIAEYKRNESLEIYDEEREKKVISKNLKKIKNASYYEFAEDYIKCLIKISKRLQISKTNSGNC